MEADREGRPLLHMWGGAFSPASREYAARSFLRAFFFVSDSQVRR